MSWSIRVRDFRPVTPKPGHPKWVRFSVTLVTDNGPDWTQSGWIIDEHRVISPPKTRGSYGFKMIQYNWCSPAFLTMLRDVIVTLPEVVRALGPERPSSATTTDTREEPLDGDLEVMREK